MRGAALALLLAAAGCARWSAIDRSRLPSAVRYPDASVAILEAEARVRYLTDPGTGEAVADVTHRSRVAVLRANSDQLEQVQVRYSLGFSRVLSLRARVLEPDGSERELDTSTAVDHPMLADKVVYSDERAISFAFPHLPVGSVLEYEYVTRHRDLRLFRFDFDFGASAPLLKARLEVSAPAEWTVEWLARRDREAVAFEPAASTEGGEVRHVWEQLDVPALRAEVASAGEEERLLQVQTRLTRYADRSGPGRAPEDAAALSAFLHGLLPTPDPNDARILALARELVAAAGDDPALKAQRLYEWVSGRVQYCALEVGYGGWIPHPAAQVLERRYGDCKDKAALLSALLAAAGIPSRLAALYAHDGVPRRFGLASVTGNFNHMILIVDLPSGPVFADPTARTVPFGQLPPSDQDAEALPLTTPGSALLRTPLESLAATRDELELHARLDAAGTARGRATLTSTGALAAERQAALIAVEGPRRDDVAGHWFGLPRSKGRLLKVKGEPFSGEVKVEGDVELSGVMRGAGEARMLRVTDFTADWLPGLRELTRSSTFVAPVAATRRARYQFQLPPGATVGRLPAPVSLDGPLGTYSLVWSAEGTVLTAERTLAMKTRRVPAAQYPALKTFVDQMFAAEAAGVVVRYLAP